MVPPLLQFIGTNPHITSEDLKHLKSCIIGGAPVPVTNAVSIKNKAPQVVIQEG